MRRIFCLALSAIAVCHTAHAANSAGSLDNTLTEMAAVNWPTAGNGLFTFSIGDQSFSEQMPSYHDVAITPGMEAMLTDGIDEMVKFQLGSNSVEAPESFFTHTPPGGPEQIIGSFARWNNEYYQPADGIDWQGDRLGRFTVELTSYPGSYPNGGINSVVTLYGGAPEPATWLLAVMGLAAITTERTAKKWKLIQAVGTVPAMIGVGLVAYAGASLNVANLAIGIVLLVIGIAIVAVGSFGAWWYHVLPPRIRF